MSLTPRHTSCRYPLDLLGESPCQGVEWTLHPLNRLLYTLLYRGKAPLRLASLPLFPRSQVRRCHPIRFHFESISFPFLFRMIGTGFAFLYQALIPLFLPRHIAPFQSQKSLSRSGTYAATDFCPFRSHARRWFRTSHSNHALFLGLTKACALAAPRRKAAIGRKPFPQTVLGLSSPVNFLVCPIDHLCE
jgi:hypothetical protein